MRANDGSEPFALVTGTSSGIGEALARELLERGWRVAGIARRPGTIQHAGYSHLRLDLGETTALIAAVDALVGPIVSDRAVRRLALVNNAALVALLGTVDQLAPDALLQVYNVNVVAPVALMGWLLRRGSPDAAFRIVNVSSGAAHMALPGLGAYGSSKAALRLAGMTLGAELDAAASDATPSRDVSILSFEPGLVDTEMQLSARTSSQEILPVLAFFQQAKAEGHLVPPSAPAVAIADYLAGDGHPRFDEQRLAGT